MLAPKLKYIVEVREFDNQRNIWSEWVGKIAFLDFDSATAGFNKTNFATPKYDMRLIELNVQTNERKVLLPDVSTRQ